MASGLLQSRISLVKLPAPSLRRLDGSYSNPSAPSVLGDATARGCERTFGPGGLRCGSGRTVTAPAGARRGVQSQPVVPTAPAAWKVPPVLDARGRPWDSDGMARKRVGAPASTAEVLALTKALADPTRLRIFLSLRQAERCVSDLVTSEGIPQPLVSHHLRVLCAAGLVETRRHDRFRLYAVSPGGIAAALARLSRVLDTEHLAPQARPGGNAACCK